MHEKVGQQIRRLLQSAESAAELISLGWVSE